MVLYHKKLVGHHENWLRRQTYNTTSLCLHKLFARVFLLQKLLIEFFKFALMRNLCLLKEVIKFDKILLLILIIRFVSYNKWRAINHMILAKELLTVEGSIFVLNKFLLDNLFDVIKFGVALSLDDVPGEVVHHELFLVVNFWRSFKEAISVNSGILNLFTTHATVDANIVLSSAHMSIYLRLILIRIHGIRVNFLLFFHLLLLDHVRLLLNNFRLLYIFHLNFVFF